MDSITIYRFIRLATATHPVIIISIKDHNVVVFLQVALVDGHFGIKDFLLLKKKTFKVFYLRRIDSFTNKRDHLAYFHRFGDAQSGPIWRR